jgi:hypothetical protein
MSPYPEAQTRYITFHLTDIAPRRRERGSSDTGFLRRVLEATLYPPTMFRSCGERDGQGGSMNLDAYKILDWAGANPLCCHRTRGGRFSLNNKD